MSINAIIMHRNAMLLLFRQRTETKRFMWLCNLRILKLRPIVSSAVTQQWFEVTYVDSAVSTSWLSARVQAPDCRETGDRLTKIRVLLIEGACVQMHHAV